MSPEYTTQAAVSSKGGMESAPSRGNGVGRANGRGPVARASLDTRNMTQFTRLQPGKGADYDDVAQRLLYNVRPFSQVLSQFLIAEARECERPFLKCSIIQSTGV